MKKYIIILVVVLLFLILALFSYQKNKELIIQGEIDTKTVDLASKVTGRIKTINIKKGDTVQKGDVLIVLDTPELEAKQEQTQALIELAQLKSLEVENGARIEQKNIAFNALNKAKSDLALAQKTYTRMKNLYQEGVISSQKLDEIETQYKAAQEGVKIAQENYDMLSRGSRYEDKLMAKTDIKRAKSTQKEVQSYLSENTIISPISGQITDVIPEEGELVSQGYTLVSIVDLEDSWVVFNLREDLLSKIKMGSEFDVMVPALGNQKIKVKVNYISVMGNFATWRATKVRGDFDLKTFEVHAKPVEENPDLRIGMSVVVDWNKIGK